MRSKGCKGKNENREKRGEEGVTFSVSAHLEAGMGLAVSDDIVVSEEYVSLLMLCLAQR